MTTRTVHVAADHTPVERPTATRSPWRVADISSRSLLSSEVASAILYISMASSVAS